MIPSFVLFGLGVSNFLDSLFSKYNFLISGGLGSLPSSLMKLIILLVQKIKMFMSLNLEHYHTKT